MENLKNINPFRVDKTTIISLEKGKLPPQALELEEAVPELLRSGVLEEAPSPEH